MNMIMIIIIKKSSICLLYELHVVVFVICFKIEKKQNKTKAAKKSFNSSFILNNLVKLFFFSIFIYEKIIKASNY
jgi:hypothetical protein